MNVISPKRKTAIVLFNLGGPDAPESVEPFLYNLFDDPAIIGAPWLVRKMLARFISKKRGPIAREIYSHMGGKSPIVENTIAQSAALKAQLEPHGEVEVFFSMRYWHPMSPEVVAQVKAYEPDHIILLPLYPQFSTTTSGSSLKNWHEEAERQGLNAPTSSICCYPTHKDFVQSQAVEIRSVLTKLEAEKPYRILFSAHGLPEKIIKKGDPYQWQVEETTKAVVKELAIKDLDYMNCYQSRVGPLKWIGPSTEDEIMRAGAEDKAIILVPIAFVSEHSETLVELDIEYKELADEHHVPAYHRVPTVAVNEHFIKALADSCLQIEAKDKLCAHVPSGMCPAKFGECPKRLHSNQQKAA
ncbi:MAG: ferrochelatase [Rickettsiales bacterium]|nr:ferrochelatase [Rickettsiales bacterium]